MSIKVTLFSLALALCSLSTLVGCGGVGGSSQGTPPPSTSSLSVGSASVSFASAIGNPAPAAQTVAVSSSGNALNFTVTTSGQSWLKVTPSSGTTPANLSVSVNPAGLAQGAYSGTVTITANGASNGPQSVQVALAVIPKNNLTVAPATLNFSAAQNGTAPAAQNLAVKASGPPVTFTAATSGEPWISLSPASGTTPGTVAISVNPAGLNPGSYTSTITISSPGATNGPQTVGVTFAVNAPGALNSVNHVIVLLQENRSFDSYFGKLNDFFALKAFPQAGQVDGIPASGFVNSGIASYHSGSVCMENLSPDWAEDHHQVNLGAPLSINGTVPGTMPMNGFVNTAAGIAKFYSFQDLSGKRAMGFYTDNELNYYYMLAGNFAVNDKFYSPAPTNTTNNRLYAFGATSQGTIHTPGGAESCAGAPIQMKGKSIFQLLDEAHISWKIYITDLTPKCDPKNGTFTTQCALASTYLQFYGWTNATNPNKPDLTSHLAPLDCSGGLPDVTAHPRYNCPKDSGGNPVTDYFTDVQNGTLPSVAFIETGSFSGRDEHPSGRDLSTTTVGCNGITGQTCISIEFGAKFAAKVINSLISSPSWNDSVFFWAFDEGGGAFDHGKPLAVPNPDGIKPFLCTTSATGVDVTKDLNVGGDFNITGFRVPNIVISPFAKKNYVSHVPMDYTAILTFIESRWSLPNLNARDKFWLDSSGNPVILDMFDFGTKAWATPPPFCAAGSTDPQCIPAQKGGDPCNFALQ